MLRFAEEIMLLLLDDESGEFAHIPEWSLRYALAGAVLMDLALENRIDTDPKRLTLLDPTPIGDDLLDPTLESIAQSSEVHDIGHWIEQTAENAYSVRDKAMKRLITHGILESRDDRFLWVFRARRYPVIDGKAEREVKLRIMEVLFSDDIPDPRDVMLICLAEACGILARLVTREELERASARIEQVRKLDLIGQAMSQAITDIELSVIALAQPHLY
jgi:hypothetical protein